jgi:diacylglycerol kinase
MDRRHKITLQQSFRCAWEGLRHVWVAERNARIHAAVAVVVMLLGLRLGLTTLEWVLLVVAMALVFISEMLNTVVELTVDLITLEHHPLAKLAKDVAAGAVLVAALAAALIGLLVLGPRLLIWFQHFGEV